MNYPTAEQVETADRITLAEWYRFLPSPGMCAIGTPEFEFVLVREAGIMSRIAERFQELGGFDPELSKLIGWEERKT